MHLCVYVDPRVHYDTDTTEILTAKAMDVPVCVCRFLSAL